MPIQTGREHDQKMLLLHLEIKWISSCFFLRALLETRYQLNIARHCITNVTEGVRQPLCLQTSILRNQLRSAYWSIFRSNGN
jgi:hypothetical protein